LIAGHRDFRILLPAITPGLPIASIACSADVAMLGESNATRLIRISPCGLLVVAN